MENHIFQIRTEAGIINTWLVRNTFKPTSVAFKSDIPNILNSLHQVQVAATLPRFGGQGYKKCACAAKH